MQLTLSYEGNELPCLITKIYSRHLCVNAKATMRDPAI
jgi:hypothetical protein